MNITTEHANGIAVVRVGESRLMYPLLSEFSAAVQKLIAAGERLVDGTIARRYRRGAVHVQRRALGRSDVGERHAVADERGALAEESCH